MLPYYRRVVLDAVKHLKKEGKRRSYTSTMLLGLGAGGGVAIRTKASKHGVRGHSSSEAPSRG
jgi:hypothetical protein